MASSRGNEQRSLSEGESRRFKFQAGKYEKPDFTSFPVRFSSFSQFHAS